MKPPPKSDKPARKAWIKSLDEPAMREYLLSAGEMRIWIKSRTKEQMSQYLNHEADRMEARADGYPDTWFAAQLRKHATVTRLNAERCLKGLRLVNNLPQV